MSIRLRRIALLVGVLALAVPGVAAASAKTDSVRIRRALTQAQAARWLRPADTARYRGDVGRALTDANRLPKARGRIVAWLLDEIARQSGSYTSPRTLALFGMLETNLDYLEANGLPSKTVDITDGDGVVYRWFGFRGFQFHPLANVGALNAAIAKNDLDATRTLADALLARAVPRGTALRWEYYFAYGSGRPPWSSGMAQAVGAQALARASVLLQDPTLLQAAGRAYAAVPAGLVLPLSEGPWIRLYSFDRLVVLNAQLQAILSLLDYAEMTGDAGASGLAASMTVAAQTLLPKFDTGYWSLYSLGGSEATLDYELFVTQLLQKLAAKTQDPVWIDTAARFRGYVKEPPALDFGEVPVDQPLLLYPQPLDGWLDNATIAFTLSKRSSVTLTIAGRTVVTTTLNRGPHTLVWKPGTTPTGTYTGQLSAVDLAGNRTTVALPQSLVVAAETAPQVQAQLQGNLLSWQGIDPGTPKLRLQLDLEGDGGPQMLDLGFHSVSGTAGVTIPPGTWTVTLIATNTAGLSTTVPLGTITAS